MRSFPPAAVTTAIPIPSVTRRQPLPLFLFLIKQYAELRQWLEYAWRESQALLPMAFQSLRITYVQSLPAPDSP